MLWDMHMHTSFSGDSKASMASMVESAERKGLHGICFTDHLDIDYPNEPELFLLDLNTYFPAIEQLKTKSLDKLPICAGIELGLQPHLAAEHQEIVRTYPFDFVIGSSHIVHGADPYDPEYFQYKSEHSAYLEYFTSILENLEAFTDFDVYGHIDYVVRYGPNKNRAYSYEIYEDILDAILEKIISLGKGIEINTGGFRHGLGHPNPTEDIVRRYHELGGEIITIGSDAHTPEHIAYDFDKIPVILKDAGFHYFTIFKNRKPEFLPIPD